MAVDLGSADKFEIVERSTSFANLDVDLIPRHRIFTAQLVGNFLFSFDGKHRISGFPLVHVLDMVRLEWSAFDLPLPSHLANHNILGYHFPFLVNDAVHFIHRYYPWEDDSYLVYDLVRKELEERPLVEFFPRNVYEDLKDGGFVEGLNEYIIFCGNNVDSESAPPETRQILAFSFKTCSWREPSVKGASPSGRFDEEASCVTSRDRILLFIRGIGFEMNAFYTLDCHNYETFYWNKLAWKNPWFKRSVQMSCIGDRIYVYGGHKDGKTPELCMWELKSNERHSLISGFGGANGGVKSRIKGNLPNDLTESPYMVPFNGKLYIVEVERNVIGLLLGVES